MAKNVGDQIGSYRLTRKIGQGGFADVYLGEHIYLHTQAAIKILHTQLDYDNIATFRNEAHTIAHLVHPHIIRVLDFNVDSMLPFLVMDYAPNGSLRERYSKGHRVPAENIVSYVKQVASGLQCAHDHNVIHRDVKPGNMLLDAQNAVLLSDFGIAVVTESSRSQKTEDEVIGTMPYMAPEQIAGKTRPASDQYALGAIVYEWLSGKRPFNGSYHEVMAQHLSTSPQPLHEIVADIPPAVEQVVQRALAKDYHQRFARIQDFADALERAYASPSTTIPPLYSRPSPAPTKRRAQASPSETSFAPNLAHPFQETVSRTPEQQTNTTSTLQKTISPALRKGARIVGRGLIILLSIILLSILLLCGLGYAAFQYFNPPHSSTSPSVADINKSETVAQNFLTDITRGQYNQAYTDFDPSLKSQVNQPSFVQQVHEEDTCYGAITTSNRVDDSTATQGTTITYMYNAKRSKMSKAYQVHITLQKNAEGNWYITDYNSNVTSIQPTCL